VVRTGGGGAFVVCTGGGGGGAVVVGTGDGDGDSDGDGAGNGDGDGDSVTRISGRSDATTSTFAVGGFGDLDGAGPMSVPIVPRVPQPSSSIVAMPTPATAAICCPLGNRASSSDNRMMRSSHTRTERSS
jgi:hypothetical protein